MTVEQLKSTICEYLSEKKGQDITAIRVSEQTAELDYFVICTGRSSTQVKSLAELLIEKLKKDYDVSPVRSDGLRDGKWSVIDYGSVMVHVFNDQTRMFYNLEKLWSEGDGKNVEFFKD